jgi:hypothetical protein
MQRGRESSDYHDCLDAKPVPFVAAVVTARDFLFIAFNFFATAPLRGVHLQSRGMRRLPRRVDSH